MNKEECFAFKGTRSKPYCACCNSLKCDNCAFYKTREEVSGETMRIIINDQIIRKGYHESNNQD